MWSTNDQTNSKLIVTNREGQEVKFAGITEIDVDTNYSYLNEHKWNTVSYEIPWYLSPIKVMSKDMKKMFKRIVVQNPWMLIS